LRQHLTRAAREGQHCDDNGADLKKFFGSSRCVSRYRSFEAFRSLPQIAFSITLESKTCKWDDAGAVTYYDAAIAGALARSIGEKAKALYDTAQLEEKQFNKLHATKLTGRS
jgi:hypothetical protein